MDCTMYNAWTVEEIREQCRLLAGHAELVHQAYLQALQDVWIAEQALRQKENAIEL